MSNLRIGRHIKEGIKNLIRNKWMTIISLLSVMVTLLIVGVFTLVILNVNNMTKGIEKNVEVVVYIDLDAKATDIADLRESIKGIKNVKTVDYINKDKGLENLIDDLGEQGKAFESLKEDNPLNDTFIIKTVLPSQTKEAASKIEGLKFVEQVDYGKDIVETLFKVTNGARTVGFVLIIGLVLTALLLIANTIKMTIEMRKEEIKIMKLVGATNLFIRIPFIIEGALLGLLGAILPVLLMYFGYDYIFVEYQKAVPSSFVNLLEVSDVIGNITILLISLSVFIGMVGSTLSISRYLKI
jgi:cell division transport system permease protein